MFNYKKISDELFMTFNDSGDDFDSYLRCVYAASTASNEKQRSYSFLNYKL